MLWLTKNDTFYCSSVFDEATISNFRIILLVTDRLFTAIITIAIVIYVNLLMYQISFKSAGFSSDASLVEYKEGDTKFSIFL